MIRPEDEDVADEEAGRISDRRPLLTVDYDNNPVQAQRDRRSKVYCAIVSGILISSTVTVTCLWIIFGRQGGASPPSSNYGQYEHAAVATDAKQCSDIGREVLLENGSSVDAAVAVSFCIGVHDMHSAGIGGGFHMVIFDVPRNGTRKVMFAVDAREMAPASASKLMYENNTAFEGALGVGVPGEVLGYYEAWHMFGRLPWKRLVQPTVDLCRNGFHVGWALANNIAKKEKKIREIPSLRAVLVKPDGSLYTEGDIMYLPKLAKTLEVIAEANGVQELYNGSLGEQLINDLHEIGANITMSDLRNYKVRMYKPLALSLRDGRVIHTLRPPSSGALLGMMLRIFEGFNLTSADLRTVDTYQKIAETFKFSYALRTYLGDEQYDNVTEVLRNVTSPAFADYIRSRIDESKTHDIGYYQPAYDGSLVESGTSHISVLGPDGSAVSMTTTVNSLFGAKRIGSRTGILFNDEMNDFAWLGRDWSHGDGYANQVEPGKRPMSSMCPILVVDASNNVDLAIGAAGGKLITSSTAFVAVHHQWLGLPINKAIDESRFHHQLTPNEIQPERDFSKVVLNLLKNKGHKIMEPYGPDFAVVQAIFSTCHRNGGVAQPGCITAVSDWRKHGAPSGF